MKFNEEQLAVIAAEATLKEWERLASGDEMVPGHRASRADKWAFMCGVGVGARSAVWSMADEGADGARFEGIFAQIMAASPLAKKFSFR